MKLHYTVTGKRNAPVVLLLHGFLGSLHDWDETVARLNERYCCIAIDLPGHGESTDDAEPYSFEATATSIIDIMDGLGVPSFSLVGYSMGGRIALYVASIYAMRVDALVLESSSPGLRAEHERTDRREADEAWIAQIKEDFGAFLSAWYKQPIFGRLVTGSGLAENLIHHRLKNSPHHLIRAMRGFSVATQPSLWEEWKINHIPTLLVVGGQDKKYCELAADMRACNRETSVSIIREAGHFVHGEAQDEYNRVVGAFLDAALKKR